MSSEFFKNRLLPLLKELGFNVLEVSSNKTISAFLYVGSVKIPFLIKFSEEDEIEVSEKDIKIFFAELNLESSKIRGLKGLYVASHFYSEEAFNSSKELGIALTTYDELLSSTVDFDEYLNNLIFEYEIHPENKFYVDQNVRTLNGDYHPLQSEIENWADDPEKNILFLLGESGMGKTSFSRNFAYTLANSFIKEPTGIPIPIFIELKDYKNTFSLSNLIIYHLFNVHNLQLRSFKVFAHLLSEGRIILILDGFDELINDPQSYEAKVFIQELFMLASGKAKVVLTSRPDYIIYNPDEATTKKLDATKIFEHFKNKKNYSLLTLRPFKYEQISRFIKLFTGIENKSLLKNVTQDKRLRDLAKYPVLLKILLETKIKKVESKSDLYEYYFKQWLNDDNWMVHLTSEGKELLAQELAWLLWKLGVHSVHFSDLPEWLSHYVRKEFKLKSDNDYLLIDIKETPFISSQGGMCSFVHDSFTHYFVAKHICKLIEEEDKTFLIEKFLNYFIVEFLCEQKSVNEIYNFFSDILHSTRNRKEKSACLIALYNLQKYLYKNEKSVSKADFEKITNELSFKKFDFMGIDLSYVLLKEIDFNGAALSYAVFQNTCFIRGNFENSDLSKTSFEKADLRYANLQNANLINSNLSFALLNNADLTGAICVDTTMIEVELMNSNCTNAKFLQANLHASLGVGAKMKGVNFNKADLQNSDFCSSDFSDAVFNETNLNHVLFEGSNFKNSTINSSYIWGCEMQKCNFENSEITNLDCRNVKFAFSGFKKANLKNINFEFADLRECQFINTEFIDVNFANSDLRQAVFKNCKFDNKTKTSLKLAFGFEEKEAINKNSTSKAGKTSTKKNAADEKKKLNKG